jgi:hypothetical protein
MIDFQRGALPSSARRHFLGIAAAVAGRFGISAAAAGRLAAGAATVSLPTLASKPAEARDGDDDRHDHRNDHDDNRWDRWDHGDNGHDPSGAQHCFLTGTHILTPSGEIRVEDLTIGSLVNTLNGPLPIKWIGRQRFRKTTTSWHWSVAPVRVARFALDEHYPSRDLYLSPKHSLFVDGILIPVERLANGNSIASANMNDSEFIEYFHIEFETHEVVFAEGAPAESLLVTSDRESFGNFIEYERLYGSNEQPTMKPFAPIFGYRGARAELEGLLRLALSPIVDVRDRAQRARDRIAARSQLVDL